MISFVMTGGSSAGLRPVQGEGVQPVTDMEIGSCTSTWSTTTGIARTERCGWSRQTQPVPGSSPRITQPRCTGVSYSAVCSTSTDELHERIYAPYAPWRRCVPDREAHRPLVGCAAVTSSVG
jgi:hypothetical protein